MPALDSWGLNKTINSQHLRQRLGQSEYSLYDGYYFEHEYRLNRKKNNLKCIVTSFLESKPSDIKDLSVHKNIL